MNDSPVLTPKARTDQLIIKELPDETLVYDRETDKAHCLNRTAATVWKNCDGQTSVKDISASLGVGSEAPVDEEIVWLALQQLEQFKLLEQAPNPPQTFAGMTRRQLMRNLGVAAVALPVVVSIVAPMAAEAQSCSGGTNRPPQCPCGSGNQCASGFCVGSKCCPSAAPC